MSKAEFKKLAELKWAPVALRGEGGVCSRGATSF